MPRKRDPNAPKKPVGRPPRVARDATPTQQAAEHANKPANWGVFRRYVQAHGATIIRARFPGVPESVIDTIWAGVPVEESDKPAYLTADRRWHDFIGG